ncbi:hypothetical protein [Paractinoplanes ferrugineus]|uniref:hypothetical protein n=1 Tax=Paractinoplanes ferrugineus TaxID=113564 RepID=UPI0019426C3D|nr:hypothetical protein [Actinoplanes ferrugineus]
MPDTFYTDRIGQVAPRTSEEISLPAWRGVVVLIQQQLDNGALAHAYPEYYCTDDPGRNTITGTDRKGFFNALEAHVPQLIESAGDPADGWARRSPRTPLDPDIMPATATVLDVIDFVAQNIEQPSSTIRHSWNGDHTHYYFGEERDPIHAGLLTPEQERFQDKIDQIFRRNGIAFTLGDDLRIRRLGPPEARALIADFRPNTGDPKLDELFNDAFARFVSRFRADRQDALEKLWDGFERLKTLQLGGQKQNSIALLLDNAASEPFRTVLDEEFRTLTSIGNRFRIRHHEHDQQELPNGDAGDYLFIRCANLIAHILRRTGRMAASDATLPR